MLRSILLAAGIVFSVMAPAAFAAEFGDLTRGPRVIDDHVRENMRKLLSDIREGSFAQEWIEEMSTGEKTLRELRAKAADQQVEEVGAVLRGLMRREGAEAPAIGR